MQCFAARSVVMNLARPFQGRDQKGGSDAMKQCSAISFRRYTTETSLFNY
jgi:hypothetical protein